MNRTDPSRSKTFTPPGCIELGPMNELTLPNPASRLPGGAAHDSLSVGILAPGVRRRRVNPIRSRMPPARAIRTGIVFRTIHGSRRMRIRPVQDRAAKSRSWSVIQGG